MARSRKLVAREPNGRAQRTAPLLAPLEVRRLIDASAAGLRAATWSSMVGRLLLDGKLSALQYSAATRWAALAADYSTACRSPLAPHSVDLDATACATDRDTTTASKEIARHERDVRTYLEARHTLQLAGAAVERAVDATCCREQMPAGVAELEALRQGLDALSSWWSTNRRKTAERRASV